MKERSWISTVLKRELAERAKKLVEANLGYRSLAELVDDAVRRRVEELEQLYKTLKPKASARLPAEANAEQRELNRGDEPRPVVERTAVEVVANG